MATYEEIYGKRVKEFNSDPTLDSSYEGQVWYNTGDGVLKSVVNFSAFISGGSLNTQRSQAAGAGTKTAGLTIGGTQPSSTAPSRTNGNKTESYNGLAYTNETNCPLYKRQGSGLGTQTAALFFGGYDDPQGYEATSAEFDGTNWTSGGTYPSDISNQGGGAGTLTAGWNAGGYVGPPGVTNGTYNYNGTSWTASGNLPYSAQNVTNLGPQTAGMAAGGNKDPGIATEWSFYDGSSWTAQSAVSAPVQANAQAGTQSNAILFGGYITSAYQATCLEWDGSAWATNPASLATRRGSGASCGVSTSINDGFMSGGDLSETTVYSATEEFNKSINTITKGAWSSGGVLNTGRLIYGGAGYKESGLVAGGFTSPPAAVRDETEEYNGTTWSEQNNIGTARYENWHVGVQTASLFFGGSYPGGTTGATEEYDGSSWSEQNDLGTARFTLAGAGTQTAGLAFGGQTPPGVVGNTEEYDGTSWSEQNDMSTARRYLMGFGIQTAAVACGGGFPSGVTTTEEYNGSSWTTGGALNTAKQRGAAGGIESDGLTFGGGVSPPSPHAVVEGYDGTSWSNFPSTSNSKFNTGGGSTTTSTGSYMCGGRPGYVTSTEEFTGTTETVTSKTLTTS